jgi:hypothetical protein
MASILNHCLKNGVHYKSLLEQTGNVYGDIRNFRRDALIQIKAIMEVHSGLLIKFQRGHRGQKSGIVIGNLSTPSILPKMAKGPIQRDPNRQPPALALVPPPERFLKPSTVAEFRRLYPCLDPYACKGDFDAWAVDLPAEKQPRFYDRAFMGFARKWIVGKLIVSNP